MDRGFARGRDVHEIDRFRERAARCDPDEHAAGSERVGEERKAVVRVVGGRAQDVERRLRIAFDQGREVDHLEALGQADGRVCRRVAPVHQDDAVRIREREEPGGDRRRVGAQRRLDVECVFADPCVVEVFPVFVVPARQPALDEPAERRVAPACPGGSSAEPGRKPGMGGADALDGARRGHAAAVPGRSQS